MENNQDAQKHRDSLEWLDDGEGARLAPDDKMTMANLANDYGYAILRSKRVAFHGCDKLKQKMTMHEQNLEALLHKLNLQDNAIKNASSKFKGKGKKIQRFCSKSFN
ncbi:hypothetical protein O181_114679 [Austropuccinia psidii MF-1]|uniref:Uncharacterized protein n=1 Tax=Austropuccinia psidii MF-1 TaxID=1389203 RepID=A0A9Q3K5Q8_9BASI|nr:hypothetical protein [Austropuccinia psidii MF-1]